MHRSLDPVDKMHFRRTMSHFATGVAILTATHDGKRFGMTINSLTSVSLSPAQVLVCINAGSPTGIAIKGSLKFGISLLSESQMLAAKSFVGPTAPRFDAVASTDNEIGVPLIDEALASIICRVENIFISGDHEIAIGEVIHCNHALDGDPLVFFGGRYGKFAATPMLMNQNVTAGVI